MTDLIKDRSRGQLAQQVTENPVYNESFKMIKAELFEKFTKTKTGDTEAREEIWRKMQSLDWLEGYMKRVMNTGKLAEQELSMSDKLKRVVGLQTNLLGVKMLSNPLNAGANEAELIQRLKAKSNPEPLEPTEEVSEPVSEELPEETTASEDEAHEAELEASEESIEDDDDTAESEELFYEIDGEEVSLDTVMQWKNGHLMQSDYTKKTQELSESRKKVEAKEAEIGDLASTLSANIEALQQKLNADFEKIDWDELRDTDPSEYLRLREDKKAREALIQSAKGTQSKIDQVKLAEEQQKLYEKLPHWTDDAKRNADVTLISERAKTFGFSNEELATISDHRILLAMLDAAKYAQLQEKSPKIAKKVAKAPKISKPGKKQQVSNLDRQIQEAHAKFKQSGTVEDGFTYKKLLRQKQRGN